MNDEKIDWELRTNLLKIPAKHGRLSGPPGSPLWKVILAWTVIIIFLIILSTAFSWTLKIWLIDAIRSAR